jgi:hypothetical protein
MEYLTPLIPGFRKLGLYDGIRLWRLATSKNPWNFTTFLKHDPIAVTDCRTASRDFV